MAKTKKLNLFEMVGEFDKDADAWKIEITLTPDGLNVVNHFLVDSKTSQYINGKEDVGMEGSHRNGSIDSVSDRYCVRRSFFGFDGFGNPEEFLYLFDKEAVDSGSNVRRRWLSAFNNVRSHGERLHALFQKMTLESCVASKKYSVKCHAEVEG